MEDLDKVTNDHWARAYHDRFEADYEEDYAECECGNKMELYENLCNNCKAHLQRQFKELLRTNFDRKDLNYLDSYIEGEYLEELVYGKED